MTAVAEPEVGKARVRKEDARLITGRSRYTDAITPPGTLHLHVVRSTIAHANITAIDATEARKAPGVFGVYTAADLGVEGVGLPCAWPITPDMKSPQRPLLATSTVHFAGEGVAVVVARSAAEARDAAELVEVDYDDLPPVLDMEAALAEGATLVHPDLGTNENATWVFDSGAAGTGGSVDEAIAAAEADPDSVVIRRRFRQQRLIPAFMEPRSCRGRPDRRADHDLRRHPDPAHPAHHDDRDDGPARGQDPGHRPGRGRRVRRQDRRAARGDALRRHRAEAGQAGEVDRDRARSRCWPPTTVATRSRTWCSRPRRTARSPASTCTSTPTSAPTSASSGRVCRSWARSCSTRSTRSRR